MTSAVCTPEDLRKLVGDEVGVSDWTVVSQSMIDAFADVTDDHQFIHLDADRAAAETPFGGTIAHGFLTLSCLSSLANNCLPTLDGTSMSVNYGFNRLRFITPVRSGDAIRGRFTLHALEEHTAYIAMIWSVTVEIRDVERPALMAEWITRKYIAS